MEGRVRYNKRVIAVATSGFGKRNHNLTYQLITKSYREDMQRLAALPESQCSPRAKDWASKVLASPEEAVKLQATQFSSPPVGTTAPKPPMSYRLGQPEDPVEKQIIVTRRVLEEKNKG
jgi:hypothetical protein